MVSAIDLVVHFPEDRKKVQLPDSRVKASRLKLLHKIAIYILVPTHHLLDYSPSGRIHLFIAKANKTWIKAIGGNDRRKKVNGLAPFVALIVFWIRKIRNPFHFSTQFNFGVSAAIKKTGNMNAPELARAVACENEPTEVSIGSITYQEAENPLAPVLKVADFFAVNERRWLARVASQRIKSQRRNPFHIRLYIGINRPGKMYAERNIKAHITI